MEARLLAPLAILLLAGCAADLSSPEALATDAPAIGVAGSGDAADHGCQVVLRSVMRMPGGDDYERECTAGTCLYVWRGSVDVAGAVPSDREVHVQYHLTNDRTWWDVVATPAATSTPGFRSYAFAFSGHTFGPSTAGRDGLVLELVAYVRAPTGGRLFDHNRFAGDFQNVRLDLAANHGNGSDGGVCQSVVGSAWFAGNWNQGLNGSLRQGGYLSVQYDLERLPQCRGTHNGYPAWDLQAFARFLPGGQLRQGTVRQLGNVNGHPTNDATAVPFVTRIPEDATAVEIWFQNFTGAGSSCVAWDSNHSANYRFDVWPAADHPRCRDVERETGVHTEDDRMAHNQPYCVGYDLAAQGDASCEFHVDGFGDGYVGHYGIPYRWATAYLRLGAVSGTVVNAGLFSRFHDAGTGAAGQRFSLGLQVEPGLWRAGVAYEIAGYQTANACNRALDDVAFFIDVRRPSGEVVRLWHSNHGANYRWSEAFASGASRESVPYGNINWAGDAAPVLGSRRACR